MCATIPTTSTPISTPGGPASPSFPSRGLGRGTSSGGSHRWRSRLERPSPPGGRVGAVRQRSHVRTLWSPADVSMAIDRARIWVLVAGGVLLAALAVAQIGGSADWLAVVLAV